MKNVKVYIVAIICFISLMTGIKAQAVEVSDNSVGSIVIDSTTGKVLYSKNADAKLPIASVSKVITMYQVLEKINSGKGSWDDKIEVSDYLCGLSENPALGNVIIKRGEKYTIRDLYEAMILVSSNSATMALGDWVGGTQQKYVDKVREWLNSLGLKEYSYVSASGLENVDIKGYWVEGTDANSHNLFSAKDVAIITSKLITDYPEVLEVSSSNGADFHGQTLPNNANPYRKGGSMYDSSLNIEGLKTGYTPLAGYCYSGVAKSGDRRVVAVVLNDVYWKADVKSMLHHGLEDWQYKELSLEKVSEQLAKTDVKYEGEAKVSLNKEKVSMLVKKETQATDIKIEVPTEVSLDSDVKEGAEVGEVSLKDTTDELGYVKENKTSAKITVKKVVKPSLFKKTNSVKEDGDLNWFQKLAKFFG